MKYRVLLYGVGAVFNEIKDKIDYDNVEVVGVIDKDKNRAKSIIAKENMDYKVMSVEEISTVKFDYILLCTNVYQNDMKKQLDFFEVNTEKIIELPNNLNTELVKKDVLNVLLKSDILYPYHINDMLNIRRRRLVSDFYTRAKSDYVRVSTFELLANQIIKHNVPGDIVECGVFRGEYSSMLNEIFNDRYLYLFDTFEGFDKEEFENEKSNELIKYDSNEVFEFFKQTSVDVVLSKMKYPEKCIVKQGYFPETLQEVNEKNIYAFVSVDFDLYMPNYKAIKYFYSRLSKGGYIIVHDYECPTFYGARKAIEQACEELGITFVPVSDENGSVIIAK